MTQGTYWIMRYYSSRGTDHRTCIILPTKTKDVDALEWAKAWAEKCTSGTSCQEYRVTVTKIRKPQPREKWLKQWDVICKRYEKIRERREILRVIGNPHDWTKGGTP